MTCSSICRIIRAACSSSGLARVWHRSLPSVTRSDNTPFVQGYGETWVTVYPSVVASKPATTPAKVSEFYGRMRIGVILITQ